MYRLLPRSLQGLVVRPALVLAMLVVAVVMSVTVSSAAAPPTRRTDGHASNLPTLDWALWPEWNVNALPDRGWFDNTNWSQIPRDLSAEPDRAWRCQVGANLHHGGPGVQAVAAAALNGAPGNPEDLDDDFEAARERDNAANPLVGKRDVHEARWWPN